MGQADLFFCQGNRECLLFSVDNTVLLINGQIILFVKNRQTRRQSRGQKLVYYEAIQRRE